MTIASPKRQIATDTNVLLAKLWMMRATCSWSGPWRQASACRRHYDARASIGTSATILCGVRIGEGFKPTPLTLTVVRK